MGNALETLDRIDVEAARKRMNDAWASYCAAKRIFEQAEREIGKALDDLINDPPKVKP